MITAHVTLSAMGGQLPEVLFNKKETAICYIHGFSDFLRGYTIRTIGAIVAVSGILNDDV